MKSEVKKIKRYAIIAVPFLLTLLMVFFTPPETFQTALTNIKRMKGGSGRGWSVSTSGDGKTIVTGSPFSEIKNGTKTAARGLALLEEPGQNNPVILTDPDFPAGAMMGASVSISPDGSVVAVGSPGDKESRVGYFTLFFKGKGGWKEPQNDSYYPFLMSFPGVETGWRLGMRTALSAEGKTVVISAPGDSGFGRIYYFTAPRGGWKKFKDIKSLVQGYMGVAKPVKGDEFGAAVAISHDDSTIVVGAPGRNGGTGGVYLFSKPNEGWEKTETLIPVELGELKKGDRFGEAIDVSGNGSVVVIGAPGKIGHSTGNVYVLTGIDYKEGKYNGFVLPTGPEMKNHGISVAVSADGKTIVAGTTGKKNEGSVMVYKSASGKWDDGQNTLNISFTEETPQNREALLGFSVDLTDDGKRVLIGAPLFDAGKGEAIWYDLQQE